MKRSVVYVLNMVPIESQSLPAGVVTVEDAALYLGLGKETVRRYLNTGKLAGIRQSGAGGAGGWRWLIPTESLNEYRRQVNGGRLYGSEPSPV